MTKSARGACRTSGGMTGRRRALLLSCGSLAIAAAAMVPSQAHAQAFNGTMTPTPMATQSITGSGTETITVNGPQATINWTPNNNGTGNIVFLPSANTATFTSASGVTDYTVLNRIVPSDPTRAIELNGTVLSTLQGTSTIGGNVWFYSPGGIVIGSSAVFDVGGLLLSTVDLAGFGADPTAFVANFALSEASAGAIQILGGAQINALQQNSYIAVVAPRIEQGGNVRVNGSAAYVAAEQLTMTMSQGLFDIAVDVNGGTADANGIVHTGSTTGPANQTANHNIYMTAVPKNQALTMLLSGTVGYDATTAFVDNGQIILAAGTTPVFGGGFSGSASASEGSIAITGGNFTSDVRADANRQINASTADGSLSFGGDIWFTTAELVSIEAFAGGSITVGGDAQLWSMAGYDGGTGGTVNVIADGGTIGVTGEIDIEVSAWSGAPNPDGYSADSQGGSALLRAVNGGAISAASLFARADGTGGYTEGGGDQAAGNGTGGAILVHSQSGGSIQVSGSAQASANGRGGDISGAGLVAGNGTGGSVVFRAEGGTIGISGPLTANAIGSGGWVNAGGSGATGGAGDGGGAGIVTIGSNSAVNLGSAVYLNVNAFGGHGHDGGQALGGAAWIESFGGAIAISGNMSLYSQAHGGDATVGVGGDGGFAQGGVTAIEAQLVNGPTASITGGNAYLDTGAWGGDGGAGDGASIAAGSGGNAQGGLYNGTRGSGGAFVIADSAGASVQVADIIMYADAFGGRGGSGGAGQAGGAGGNATGGLVQSGTYNPNESSATLGTAVFGNLYMNASGYAGDGGVGDQGNGAAPRGTGGDAEAGMAWVGAAGTVTIADASLYTHAHGGEGSVGGDAQGGFAQFASFNPGSTLTVTGDVLLDGDGIAGDGDLGGSGTGGYSGIGAVSGATLNVAGSVSVTADGQGGSSDGTGGSGTGGMAGGGGEGGTFIAGSIDASANGEGGDGAAGGAGIGGEALITAWEPAGSVQTGSLDLEANGIGGAGSSGAGGSGEGGSAEISIDGGTVTVTTLDQYANGLGGDGVSGGNGTGGTGSIIYSAAGGSLAIAGMGWVEANGTGGDGTSGAGGLGTGGVIDVALGAGSALQANFLYANAMGLGGNSDSGAGGAGIGGISTMLIAAGGELDADQFYLFADAGGGSSASGAGGNAAAGEAGLTLDGGTLTSAQNALVTADAGGGSGATGGSAAGGSALIAITANGASVNAGILGVSSFGRGGDGTAGAGGNATGGTAQFDIVDTLSSGAAASVAAGTLSINVTGAGGDGTGAAGGSGTGGDGLVQLGEGTTTTSNLLVVNARGTGGEGSSGGTGSGGSAALVVRGGASLANLGAGVDINADGLGGNGLSGVGGNALAGSASVDILGTWAPSGEIWVSADGEGGDGETGGGDGTGGDAAVRVRGSLAQTSGSLNVRAAGTGGSSASGTGGDGAGGYARMSAFAGGTIVATSVTVDSGGHGGDGVDGGDGSGGMLVGTWGGSVLQTLDAGSSMTLSGDTRVVSNGTGGAATGASGIGGDGHGGAVAITANAVPLTIGTALLEASGSSGDGPGGSGLGSGGQVVLTSLSAPLTGGALTIHADGSTAGGRVELHSEAAGSLAFDSLSASAGEILVAVDQASSADIGAAELAATGTGGAVVIDLGAGSAPASAADLLFADSLAITGATIDLISRNGAGIDVAGAFAANASGALSLDDLGSGAMLSADTITLSGATVLLDWGLQALDIAISAAGNYTSSATVSAGRSLSLSAGGSMQVGDLHSEQSIALQSGGNLTTGNVSTDQDLSLSAAGSLVTGDLDAAGNLALSAGGNLTVEDVSAGGSASLVSGGTAIIQGLVSAPVINLTSADLAIGSAGGLGEAGVTDTLDIVAVSNSPVIIGGAGGTSGQYHLSQAEADRIEADAISFTARGSSGGDPDVLVHDFIIGGSQTAGGGVSQVALATGGTIIVDGNLLYANAAAGDSLSLTGEAIQVVTDSGSVAMTAGDGSLSGTLLLTADDIWIAERSIIDQLEADPDFAGRDQALSTPGSGSDGEGNVRAGGVSATITRSLLVQNSGTGEDYGGLTVGEGGFAVTNASSSPATVIVYGRRLNTDGSVTGGGAFAGSVEFAGSPATSDSTVNGCTVGGTCVVAAPPIPGSDAILGPPALTESPTEAEESSESEDDNEEDEGGSENSVNPAARLINSAPLQLDRSVDHPVTSGNDAMLDDGGPK